MSVVDLCRHLNPRGRFRCIAAVFQGLPGASNEGSGEAVSGFFFGVLYAANCFLAACGNGEFLIRVIH